MWKLSKGYMKVKRWTFKLTPSQNPANQSITQVSRPQPCHACGFAAIYFHFRRRNFWIDGQARELHGWNDWIRLDYRVDSVVFKRTMNPIWMINLAVVFLRSGLGTWGVHDWMIQAWSPQPLRNCTSRLCWEWFAGSR